MNCTGSPFSSIPAQRSPVPLSPVPRPQPTNRPTRPKAYNKRDSIAVRFGASAPSFISRVAAAGAPYGLTFLWSGRTGSTRDSHKLLLLAGDLDNDTPPPQNDHHPLPLPTANYPADPRPESSPSTPPPPATTPWLTPAPPTTTKTRQESLLTSLFAATLSHGQDVSSRAFLVPLAVAHGLGADAAAVEAYLDSAAASERVEREAAAARQTAGVTAVPSYVVNGRYRVGGWQEPGVFGGVFGRIRGAAGEGKEGGGREGDGEGLGGRRGWRERERTE